MKSWKKLPVLLIIVFLLAACGSKLDPNTGIKGTVYLASCTGSEVATNCTASLPFQVKLDIYDQNLKKIDTITTNQNGTFQVPLKPGMYFIHPQNNGKYPIAADFRVTVVAGKLADLTIYYDTGVR
jgi:hypothetical protein